MVFQLPAGATRKLGGPVPTTADLDKVSEMLAGVAGFRGRRNRAFFAILRETGCRVNALRCLDAASCFLMSDGNIKVWLHDKGKQQSREVELSRSATDFLLIYVAAYNACPSSQRTAGCIA